MAATFQTQNSNNNSNSNNNKKNPQLKRVVYSKYRELLGSYNDKANAIIETLPPYMVKEDRGFHLYKNNIDGVSNVIYPSGGSLPMQTTAAYEAPACVQNAMMTKDKKPFTYTPGGIDLSQIKSQRMAKRLARNAQIEGASGVSQQNRPVQQLQTQSNGSPQPPNSPSMIGPAAMGMPFQVFPTGPPPSGPQSIKRTNQTNGNCPQPPPPPPPTMPSTLTPPGVNGNGALSSPANNFRKSPTPQNFEPPPMGFRPEIKIPPNPMAKLRKVPPPQEKNNFWVEEYRRESSKSPMVGDDENDHPEHMSPNNSQLKYQQSQTVSNAATEQQYQSSVASRPEFRSVAAPQSRAVSVYTAQSTPTSTPHRAASPFKFSQEEQQSKMQEQESQLQQNPQTSQFQQQQQTQVTTPNFAQPQTVPWRTQNSYSSNSSNQQSPRAEELSPQVTPQRAPSDVFKPYQSPQQDQQSQPLLLYNNVTPAASNQQQQMNLQKNSNVGSLYIPPIASENRQPPQQQIKRDVTEGQFPEQHLQPQQQRPAPTNRWMTTQPPSKEPAEWVRSVDNINVVPSTINRNVPSTPTNGYPAINGSSGVGSGNGNGGLVMAPTGPSGLRLHISTNSINSNNKERIIPIEIERSPGRAPVHPSLAPQPFYNTNLQHQISSVPTPPPSSSSSTTGSAVSALPSYVVRSPNQFVDQGYNNFSQNQQQSMQNSAKKEQQPQSSTPSGTKTHIIPIAIEGHTENSSNNRGPISQSPMIIKNDPRTLQHQNSWGTNSSSTPTQSKSFRILQKITDTIDRNAVESPKNFKDECELQPPQYSRQMGPSQQLNSPTIEQMKRMQISQDQMARNQDTVSKVDENVQNEKLHPTVDGLSLYRGSSNPSKSFRRLQSAMNRCSTEIQSPRAQIKEDVIGTSPIIRTPQSNRYVEQHQIYSKEEAPQYYIHPSEQQVPEPKIYTGSAIPSRSFKILQAMTTPENAAEMEGSDVIVKLNEPNASQNFQSNNSEHLYPIAPPHYYPYPYSFPYSWYYPTGLPPPPLPPPLSSKKNGEINNNSNWHFPSHVYPIPQIPLNDTNTPPFYLYYSPVLHEHNSPYELHFKQEGMYWHPHSCPPYPHFTNHNREAMTIPTTQPQNSFRSLPDIIITPSADDIPHNVFKNNASNFINTIKREEEKREGSVLDVLSRKLSEISKPVELNLNMSRNDDKRYVGDNFKEFDTRYSSSPIIFIRENEMHSSDDDTSSEEIEKEVAAHEKKKDSLKAIKAVTNVQVYNQNQAKIIDENNEQDEEMTSIDESSDVFENEDDGEEEEEEEVEIIGEYEDEEEFEAIEDEDLSVIYEESEIEKNSHSKNSNDSNTIANTNEDSENEYSNENCFRNEIFESDDDCDENSTSVTVRLPLRFSFSRSSNDENIATIEIGDSEIERRREGSLTSLRSDVEKKSTQMMETNQTFSTSNDDSNKDCNVSVTINLSHSLGKLSSGFQNVKSPDNENIEEDVSATFSIPMRNGGRSDINTDHVLKHTYFMELEDSKISDEDFIEKLYPIKSKKNVENRADVGAFKAQNTGKINESKISASLQRNSMVEVSFWSESIGLNNIAEKPATCKQFMRESSKEIQMWSAPLRSEIETLPKALVAEISINPKPFEEIEQIKENYKRSDSEETEKADENETDFWALICNGKENQNNEPVSSIIPENEPQNSDEEIDFWAQIAAKDDETVPYNMATNLWAKPIEEADYVKKVKTTKKAKEISEVCASFPHKDEKRHSICESGTETADQLSYDNDECESRRHNYRKAMTFFTTSVDDRKEETDFPSRTFKRDTKSMGRFSKENVGVKAEMFDIYSSFKRDTKSLSRVTKLEEIIQEREPAGYKPWDWQSKDNSVDNKVIILLDSNPSGSEEEYAGAQNTISGHTENEAQLRQMSIRAAEFEINNCGITNSEKKANNLTISVRDRITAFEAVPQEVSECKLSILPQTEKLSCERAKSSLSRNNSSQRSESELEEDDSGVTDMNKQLSETDTETENFPELRKMTRYQRASTHSRLFKLLQGESEDVDEKRDGKSLNSYTPAEVVKADDQLNPRPNRRKIVHNVSITRKQNPKALQEAETMLQRRERLSLPLCKNSIDADNPSTPNSPASPVSGHARSSTMINDKLVNELIESLLLKRSSSHLRNLPMEKLQAAAKRVLEEEFDSLDNATKTATATVTLHDGSNSDYNNATDFDILPSRAFKALQTGVNPSVRHWSARCPRVLSSKTVNRDLARVTESPEILARTSKSPENFTEQARSVGRWRKI